MKTYLSGTLFHASNNNYYILLKINTNTHVLFDFKDFTEASSHIYKKHGEVLLTDIYETIYYDMVLSCITDKPRAYRKSSYFLGKKVDAASIEHRNLVLVYAYEYAYTAVAIRHQGMIGLFDIKNWKYVFDLNTQLPSNAHYYLLLDKFNPKVTV